MTDLSKYEGITPGPWEVEDPFVDYLSITIGDRVEDWRFVAHVQTDLEKGGKTRVISKAQMQANAFAIAGLPDILAYARELEARNAELMDALGAIADSEGCEAYMLQAFARVTLSRAKMEDG
ncbi:hypothetical protein [Marinobacter sp.]|uniref:hypothetical protein n=1 Tax=Marinobacter sp. TaxID=50741 RepID=UPI000C962BEC|nr:hypothetical protein [Marinobacter sp.]MAB53460.1 hypothetical protein [Marinobacter sp.]|tara:strand:- start:154 stop:519 length:366 start_codon:yes stop_codon:yes gene_type:complete